MLAVRSFERCDLSIDCLRRHVFCEVLEYISTGWSWEWVLETQVRCLDKWRLRQLAWRWALRISRQAEVGSESWRHKWGVWTIEDSDNLPGDKQREISKIGRLKLGVDPGDTSEVFGQVKTPTTGLEVLECKIWEITWFGWNRSVWTQGKYRHPIRTKNGQSQSHQQPTVTWCNGGAVHWLDYWIREGDECLSADTDYARSLGMAFAVTWRCSSECESARHHSDVPRPPQRSGNRNAEADLWDAWPYLRQIPQVIARLKYLWPSAVW